jgi:hypothetical protein
VWSDDEDAGDATATGIAGGVMLMVSSYRCWMTFLETLQKDADA